MKNVALDKLVLAGAIKSYCYDIVNEDGQIGYRGHCRNTERLHLEFPDGNMLTVDTFCSGYAEDTSMEMWTNAPGVYHKLTAIANSKYTVVYLADMEGNLICRDDGKVEDRFLAGHYRLRFGSGDEPRLIELREDMTIREG